MKRRKKTFKFKIIIPVAAILLFLVASMSVFQSVRFSKMGNSLINEKLHAVVNSLRLYLEERESDTRVAAASMAFEPGVVEAILIRDTDKLQRILTTNVDLYRVTFFTITDTEGVILARTHEFDSPGEAAMDLQNVKDALAGKTSTYYESGEAAIVSIRSGAPVYDTDGTLIGAVSAGSRLDTDNEVYRLKDLFGCEATVFFGDTRVVTTITKDGSSIAGTLLDARITEIVLEKKQEYLGDADVLGEKYKTYYKPLFNADNDAFAILFLGIPLAALDAEMNRSIQDGIALGLAGLITATVLLYAIISSISQPITKLSSSMHDIANGDLNIEIEVKSDDEVGKLGMSLIRVADTLHKLLDDIDVMITEHKRGNTDYCLDSDDFTGDYKTLADNILELAAYGMIDQLTGIPNRRSFDNRMEMEWERAARGKQPVSFLLLDVDGFKKYNDAFGHQQGDVALQMVADAIRKALNRSVDFAARWGGEEFVVLLPDTDVSGSLGVAERIRTAVEATAIPCEEESGRNVTISIGVNTTTPTPGAPVTDFITCADAALYQAKEQGRNMTIHA